MKKFFLSMALLVVMILSASCEFGNKANTVALQRENDSLMLVNAQTKADYDEILQLINEIQIGFEEIKSAENFLIVNKNGGDDIDMSVRERIAEDMTLISKTLKENKDRINKLQRQLNESKNVSAQLNETINTLNGMIDEKTRMITELQSELAKRDIRIAELDEAVTSLTQMNAAQSDVISSQDSELNQVFYAFGTSKELREQKIIEKRGRNLLKGNFNHNYFTEIDMRNVTSLALGSKKADILTAHPNSSYSFDKDANGFLTLNILNPKLFWSTSKYLVVEVE